MINTTYQPIGITLGEPAGIGPDILLKLIHEHQFHRPLVAITDVNLIQNRAALLGFNPIIDVITEDDLKTLKPGPIHHIYVLQQNGLDEEVIPGFPKTDHAQWVLNTIKKATELCASGHLGAMVTGPVQKSIINDAGILFSGHTEYIADTLNSLYQNTDDNLLVPLMMLTSGEKLDHPLRVALVTTHHPVEKVPALITEALVIEKVTSLHKGMKTFYGIENPKILVAGLNPHAGEQGHLGMEEIDTIIPALKQVQDQGINAIGPLPADTLFTPRHLEDADAVLAMYHDQGLPVLKYASFGSGINVTLGLKIVRTSVDHGTALDLAGSLKADHSSLKAAITEAEFILSHKI